MGTIVLVAAVSAGLFCIGSGAGTFGHGVKTGAIKVKDKVVGVFKSKPKPAPAPAPAPSVQK